MVQRENNGPAEGHASGLSKLTFQPCSNQFCRIPGMLSQERVSHTVWTCDTVVNGRREGASLEYTRINFGYFLCANTAMRNATLIVFAPSLTPRTRALLRIFSAFRSHATAMPARSKSRTHHSDKSRLASPMVIRKYAGDQIERRPLKNR